MPQIHTPLPSDLSEAQGDAQVQLLLRRAELVQRIAALAPNEGLYETAVPGLHLARLNAPNQPHHGMHMPAICFIAQGAKRLHLADELYDYDDTHHLVVAQDLPVMGQVWQASREQPYLSVRLDFDPAVLAELVRHAPPEPAAAAHSASVRGLFVGRTGIELLDPLLRLLRLLETPQHLQALAPLALQEISYRLLSGPDGWRLAQTLGNSGCAARIAQAIQWLRRRVAEPLSIAEMADAVHMSPSSLHHHFKAVTAMSPLQYQKRLRLQEARGLMLSGGLDAASAAHRVGYQSPSQFSREYARMYGAPPARDLREFREQQALAAKPAS
ncbi:AraC family transcriptional regulator [Roseateles sp. DAIF2]|uniref:AraC family transcriptional regulator n=1 Tax=Roseateles sp. DAIF2 TaxID=2714952 RepID=UPI0018A32B7E|nr:AraC family transcriptional regulator [Roseateles sp. DAIF2]QPF75857.1 AraC family transcriptional regulator [Roseateles sp. DAIF2]